MSVPSSAIVPASTSTSRTSARSSVLLPVPDGPSRPVIRPGGTSRSKPSRILRSPSVTTIPRAAMPTAVLGGASVAAGRTRVAGGLAGVAILRRPRLGRIVAADLVLRVVLRIDAGPRLAVLGVARAGVGRRRIGVLLVLLLVGSLGHTRQVPA